MQLPKHGIETINNTSEQIMLPPESLPWIEGDAEVSAARVTLENGTEILYASAIGLHAGVEKYARRVPLEQSQNAEQGLFKALPSMIGEDRTSALPLNIDSVPTKYSLVGDMYKVDKIGKNAARLFFVIRDIGRPEPLVLKVGIANHDQQVALQGIIGSTDKRRKADGARSK